LSPESHDVVVVGGGLAGLGAAYRLRHRDVVVLEAEHRLGGRIESLRKGDYWLNLGAHLLNGDDCLTARLAGEVGATLAHPRGSVTGIALNGRVVAGGAPELMPFRLTLPLEARLSLMRTGLRMRRALRMARTADPISLLGDQPDPADLERLPVQPQLDAISFRTLLGEMHPDVAALMATGARRAGGELDEISGYYGIIATLGAWAVKRPNIVNGTEELIYGLQRALGSRARTGQQVRAIVPDTDGVDILVGGSDGAVRTVHSCVCVVAVPASVAQSLIHGLPEWKVTALRSIPYSPFVVAGVFTREQGRMPWDKVYAIATPKYPFTMFFNAANALRDDGPRRPGGALVVYSAGEPARRHLGLADDAIRDLFLAGLADLFPVTKGIVDEVIIRRQPFGGPTPVPGRAQLQHALVRSVGRVVFAGDYLQYSGLDYTLRTALHAAREAETYFREVAYPADSVPT
jgi:oxygen-dependent protoporphyrinogen oxidase